MVTEEAGTVSVVKFQGVAQLDSRYQPPKVYPDQVGSAGRLTSEA